ncbi:SMI1/KNR4 family protein [Amycolatopsis vastitatis]|uniref:SMI1/KNR4 family protein n=1 Tax=Amycolatopsis vastitatis TaxID=1905142 RepID=UPI00196B1A87|nr:SMI1/KNR4 family protein [Amycolatopsis vastitatis]
MTDLRPLDQLLAGARAPLGPRIELDLGHDAGPLAELAELLTRVNGFTAFNAGVQVFHAGEAGLGPELGRWNEPTTWKNTYAGLADRLFCFGQDLFGCQFAISDNREVVVFDPETAERTPIGASLDEWAAWLLEDPAVRGAHQFATAWQDEHGALGHDQRLIPLQLFTMGGAYDFDNLVAKDAVTCMRIRGPLAQTIHELPDGAQVHLMAEHAPAAKPGSKQLAYAELDVFADYNSFMVQDETARFEPDRAWTKALITDMIAARDGVIGVGTARRTTVPVILDVRSEAPDDNFESWDHVTEAGLHVESGDVIVSMLDYSDSVPRTAVPAGDYMTRVYARGFSTISSDGIHGDDLYHVVLWPGTVQEPRVLVRYPDVLSGG